MLDNTYKQSIIEQLNQAVIDYENNELLNPNSEYSDGFLSRILELEMELENNE